MGSTTMDTLELTDYADRYSVDRLASLDGVAQVRIGGRQRYAMRILLDAAEMAARDITPADVEAALRAENVELPAGRIESRTRDFHQDMLGPMYQGEGVPDWAVETLPGSFTKLLGPPTFGFTFHFFRPRPDGPRVGEERVSTGRSRWWPVS